MRYALILGLAGALATLPSMALAQKDDDQAGVQEAIRFERAKQAAADRQARIEEARERSERADERSSADRSKNPDAKTRRKTVKSAEADRTAPPPPRQ